jgi:DtxR family Mn-dependent transcriptional regulator
LGLVPGTVVQRLSSGPEVVVFRANGDEIRLSPTVADNLSVVILPGETAAAPAGRPLSSLRPGMRGVVLEISPRCRGAERRRMLDLGILPGTEIEAVMTSPAGDPTAYRIRDALIALRRTQAALIRIESDPA